MTKAKVDLGETATLHQLTPQHYVIAVGGEIVLELDASGDSLQVRRPAQEPVVVDNIPPVAQAGPLQADLDAAAAKADKAAEKTAA